MKKNYKVHVSLRWTNNYEINASSEEEAIEKALILCDLVDITDPDYTFAEVTTDILEVK